MNPWLYLAFFIAGVAVLYLLADRLARVLSRPEPAHRCLYCQRRYGDDTVACCAMCADDPWGEP